MFDYVYDALNGSTAVVTFSDINAHDHVSISSDDFSIHGKDLQVYSHIADSPRHSEVVFVRGDGSTVASFMGTHAHELTINFDQRTASIAFDIPPLLELLGCDGQLLPPEEGSKYAGSVVIDGGQLQLAKNSVPAQSTDGAPMQQRGEAVDDATDENFDEDEGVVEIATSQREVVDAPIIEVSAPTETANSDETADTQQALEASQPDVTTTQDQLPESVNGSAAVQPAMDSEAAIPASNNDSDEEEQAQEVAHSPVVEDLADLGEEIRTEGEQVGKTSAQPEESALEVVVEDVYTEEDTDIIPTAANIFSWV
ncbi:hypothetical protein [Anaplasma marginale]